MPDNSSELNTSHLSGDIGRRSVRGGAIMFAAQVVKVGLQIGSVIVLARLLAPGAFGLIAMVAALSSVLDLVKELGLSTATIQRENLTQAQVSALFWINVAAGSIVAALLVAAAPLVARFYGQPDLVAVTRWLALGFVFSGLTTQHWALLRRQMRFGPVALIDGVSDVGGIVVAVALAVAGAGFWALVAQRLVPVTANLIGSWIVCRWRPTWPHRAPVRDLLMFGLSVTGCGIVSALARSVDQILIGWMWGPTVLGLYERAAKLLLVPLNNINLPLYSVALPALSRLAGTETRYRAAVRGLYEKMTMVTMPAGALVAMTGDWLAPLLFGQAWHAAGPLVICFGAAAVTQPTIISVGLLYIPLNRGRELLRSTIVDAGLCILLFAAGLPYGAVGVAASFAAGSLCIRLPIAFWLATRRGPVTLRDLFLAVVPSLIAALAVAAVIFAMRQVLVPASTHDYLLAYAAVVPAAFLATAAVFVSFRQSRAALATMAQWRHMVLQRAPAEGPR